MVDGWYTGMVKLEPTMVVLNVKDIVWLWLVMVTEGGSMTNKNRQP